MFFKVGTEYRITPISGSGNGLPTLAGLNTNTDFLNTGAALSFGLEYFVTKNFSLGFDNTLRFDTVTINFGDIALDRGSSSNRKTFLFGWHFHANYYIKVFKKSELFFRIGLSRLNGGADVATQDLFRDDNGEITGGVLGTFDLASFAGNFAIGYKNKRIEALLGIYLTDDSNFSQNGSTNIIPYIKITYNLGKL